MRRRRPSVVITVVATPSHMPDWTISPIEGAAAEPLNAGDARTERTNPVPSNANATSTAAGIVAGRLEDCAEPGTHERLIVGDEHAQFRHRHRVGKAAWTR
jgi:hypothetical protein